MRQTSHIPSFQPRTMQSKSTLDPPVIVFLLVTYISTLNVIVVSLDSINSIQKSTLENSFTSCLHRRQPSECPNRPDSCNGFFLCTWTGVPACIMYIIQSTSPVLIGFRHQITPMLIQPFYTSARTTGNWKLCRDWFNFFSFDHFDSAIYWNGALHWLETKDIQDGDYIGSREFTIYEMRKGCSVWSVRYLVNTDDFRNPLPEGWLIWSIIWSIVLGEREEDSCLVINLSGKVVEYNLISKTLHDIYNIRSNQLDDDDDDDHNVYEFIPSFTSV
ncbi:hypothetical protein Tco_0019640 [Tanacetum coccineum]